MAGMVFWAQQWRRHVVEADRNRTADQSEGGKTVGVDPTVVTARQ